MSGFRNIMPRTSEAEHKANCLFASVGDKAIQNGFFARENRKFHSNLNLRAVTVEIK